MEGPIESVVIVGGGTAGWLAALYLDRALNRGANARVAISVIESPQVGIIGVGEATVPHLRSTAAFLGLDEDEWMAGCNASFKIGLRFVGWSGRRTDDVIWSPFDPFPSIPELEAELFAHLRRRAAGLPSRFDFDCFRSVRLCHARKAPRLGVEPPYQGQVQYAYQLDAALLATYLRRVARARGVHHVVDTVERAELDTRGYIASLTTQGHGAVRADLYLDCTGFRGLLINQALGEPFESYADALPCDRAIALPVPHRAGAGIDPYTTATALRAGWAWHTPLYSRVGTGYVYASQFASPDQAERELRAHVGAAADGIEARHLTTRVGRTRKPWVNNCVAVGLSAGFLEPLEATGIYLIEIGLKHLAACFPDRRFEPTLARTYNQLMASYYEEIRDFIAMHYCVAGRRDAPFWEHCAHGLAVPDSLRARLETWRALDLRPGLLSASLAEFDGRAFGKLLWFCYLVGQDYVPARNLASPAPHQPASERGSRSDDDDEAALGDHGQYLDQLHRGGLAALQRAYPDGL